MICITCFLPLLITRYHFFFYINQSSSLPTSLLPRILFLSSTTNPPHLITKVMNTHTLLTLLAFLHLFSPLIHAQTPRTDDISGRFESLFFEHNYATIWGEPKILEDGRKVQLRLDRQSGGGFISQDNYYYAFYSASIKLPANYTAGVVLAFYTSNGDAFPQNHDELDFEFLGNLPGKKWKMQTNIYGNGSVSRGREERFDFWFDPTQDFHDYSILWNHKHIVFMVDNIPIREMKRTEALKGDYPSKPMALYATIWDGSGWATDGGRYPVNYEHEPFVATFTNLKLEGCSTNPIEDETLIECRESLNTNPAKASDLQLLTANQRAALKWVRSKHMYYSYCNDKRRYPVPLPECSDQPFISASYLSNGRVKVRRSHSRTRSLSHRQTRVKERTLMEETTVSLSDDNIKISIPPSFRLKPHPMVRRIS